ncbi:hypothetical protein tinsulaeT_34950 [Thalassotalea insulae]|uniref:DUF6916 domain-containing protein n=1 Tax=Thalassotalea insulae TaxID=2056778 RepID=A0ABQ6H089_9GAMM|nr:hypothetical protein [Thalassotalea insulae]GLX80155.1 hypothetical protein tinsulaeT_34950 [Thalassotalea insulae]
MQALNCQSFINLIGENIQLTDDKGNSAELEITAVKPSKHSNEGWCSHAICFKGSPEFHFTQGSYSLTHPDLTLNSLFISPKSLIDYEAIISSPIKD